MIHYQYFLTWNIIFSTNGIYLDSQVSRNSSGKSTYNQIGMREGSHEPFDGYIGEIIIINSVEDWS